MWAETIPFPNAVRRVVMLAVKMKVPRVTIAYAGLKTRSSVLAHSGVSRAFLSAAKKFLANPYFCPREEFVRNIFFRAWAANSARRCLPLGCASGNFQQLSAHAQTINSEFPEINKSHSQVIESSTSTVRKACAFA